eukprot:g20013.t1
MRLFWLCARRGPSVKDVAVEVTATPATEASESSDEKQLQPPQNAEQPQLPRDEALQENEAQQENETQLAPDEVELPRRGPVKLKLHYWSHKISSEEEWNRRRTECQAGAKREFRVGNRSFSDFGVGTKPYNYVHWWLEWKTVVAATGRVVSPDELADLDQSGACPGPCLAGHITRALQTPERRSPRRSPRAGDPVDLLRRLMNALTPEQMALVMANPLTNPDARGGVCDPNRPREDAALEAGGSGAAAANGPEPVEAQPDDPLGAAEQIERLEEVLNMRAADIMAQVNVGARRTARASNQVVVDPEQPSRD